MKNVVEKMQQMKFSQRFVEDIEIKKTSLIGSPYGSLIDATLELEGDNVKKVKCTAYLCRTISYFKKFDGTETVSECESFAIYRERRYGKSVFLLVRGKEICAKFSYEEDPIIVKSKLNVKGHDIDVLFLTFPNEQETLAILSVAGLLYIVGIPFAITAADSDKVTLQCELNADVSVESIENARTSFFLTFSF